MASAGQYFRVMLLTQCELEFLTIATTVWILTRNFGTEMERYCFIETVDQADMFITRKLLCKCNLSWDDIQSKYDALRQLTNLISHIFGWNVGLYTLDYILFNSVTIDEMFVPGVFHNF